MDSSLRTPANGDPQGSIESTEQLSKTTNLHYPFLKRLGKLGKGCTDNCGGKLDCKKFPIRERKNIFNEFWIEFNSGERLLFIQNNITIQNDKKHKFYLKSDGKKYQVCKTLFSSTLGLFERDIQKVINDMFEKQAREGSSISGPIIHNEAAIDPLDGCVGKIEHVEVNVDIGSILHEDSSDDKPLLRRSVKKFSVNDKKTSLSKKRKSSPSLKKKKLPSKKAKSQQNSSSSQLKSTRTLRPQAQFKQEPPETDDENDFGGDDDNDEDYISAKPNQKNRKPVIKREIDHKSDSDELSSDTSSDDDDDQKEQKPNPEEEIQKTFSADGITKPMKFGPPCNSDLCRKKLERKCFQLSETQRDHIFNTFWSIGQAERVIYLKSNIDLKNVSMKYLQGLPIYHLSDSTGKVLVCSRMFHSTLAIQPIGVLNFIFDNKPARYLMTLKDQNIRTKRKDNTTKRINKITYEAVEILDDFLESIPKIPPKTFLLQRANKVYLSENYTIRKVYEEYKVMTGKMFLKSLSRHLLKRRLQYKQYLIYKGRKLKEARVDNDPVLSPELKLKIKHCQQERFKDNAIVKKYGKDVMILEMDFIQKMVPNKHNDADLCESSERLCVYNLTICNSLNGHSQCYWFCEIDCEFDNPSSYITCLMHYLKNNCHQAKQVIIYTTRPQFKNLDMANALLDYAVQNQITITQKFIPKEKSQTICESIFQSIERKLRRLEIYLPSDYITASQDSKRDAVFTKLMNFSNFKDFSTRSSKHRYTGFTTYDENQFLDDFKALMFKSNGEIAYKVSFEDEWNSLPERNKAQGFDPHAEWMQLYLERRKITPVKYQLLQSLKSKMPRDCHFFYDYLTIEI